MTMSSQDLRECMAGIRALARQLRVTDRLWTSPEGPEYVAAIERASQDALELLVRLEAAPASADEVEEA